LKSTWHSPPTSASFREPKLSLEFNSPNHLEVEALDISWELNPVFDTSDIKRTKRTASHIVSETAEARKWPGFNSKAIAIASDGSGNYLVFLPNGASTALQDAVFVWWHEEAKIERVAESFEQLC
jgi:hypothetical protein